jgi:hypothetical protein
VQGFKWVDPNLSGTGYERFGGLVSNRVGDHVTLAVNTTANDVNSMRANEVALVRLSWLCNNNDTSSRDVIFICRLHFKLSTSQNMRA